MNYDSLPLLHFDNAPPSMDQESMLRGYAQLQPDFLLSDAVGFLQGDVNMACSSKALINIMGTPQTAGDLLYCQFFSILDAQPSYYTRREFVDSYELRFTLSGSGVLEYRGRQYHLQPGEGYFISNKKPHYYYAEENGWKCTILHINGTLCEQFFSEYASAGGVKFNVIQFPAFETLQFQVLKATQKLVPYVRYRVSTALHLLLTELLSAHTGTQSTSAATDDAVAKVIEYLRSHYTEKIVFSNLAKEFGLSHTALFSKFKQYTGYTPVTYLTELRIAQAKLMLRGTSLSIEEVALRTGFSDSGRFSQTFKKVTGITPLKYRKA